jgi:hypothetical protein
MATPGFTFEWLAQLLYVQEVQGSSLSLKTTYPD